MKKTTLLTISLIISYFAIGQTGSVNMPYPTNRFWTYNSSDVQVRLKDQSDTLELFGSKIKFIKIDGFIYEIKRYSNISIEKVKPNWTTVLTDLAKKVDTINAKKQN